LGGSVLGYHNHCLTPASLKPAEIAEIAERRWRPDRGALHNQAAFASRLRREGKTGRGAWSVVGGNVKDVPVGPLKNVPSVSPNVRRQER